MSGALLYPVLAGGEVWPEGTTREDRGAEVIPAGPWWSDFDPAAPAIDPDGDDDSTGEGELFDPAAHTVDDVLAYLGLAEGGQHLTPEELARVIAAESEGKARKTLLDALGAVDPAAYGQPADDSQD